MTSTIFISLYSTYICNLVLSSLAHMLQHLRGNAESSTTAWHFIIETPVNSTLMAFAKARLSLIHISGGVRCLLRSFRVFAISRAPFSPRCVNVGLFRSVNVFVPSNCNILTRIPLLLCCGLLIFIIEKGRSTNHPPTSNSNEH